MTSSSTSSSRDPTNTLENAPTTRGHARDDPDQVDAAEATDPHTRDDPNSPGLLERIRPSTWGQWSAVFMIGAAVLAVVLYVTRLYPPGYHNPWLIVIGLLVGGYPIVGLFFREQGFKARSMLDTVVVKLGSPTRGIHALVYTGDVENSPGGFKLAKELKKTTFGGFPGSWVTLDDLLHDDDLELASKRHRDPDDPAAIELDGRFTAVTKTDLHGDVYVVDADDVEYDFDARDIDRRTTPPAYIDEGATGMLIQELEFSSKREQAARDEIQVVENRLEELRKRVQDEQIPELDGALAVLDRLQESTLAPRERRREILRDERSDVVDQIDDEVDEEMGEQ